MVAGRRVTRLAGLALLLAFGVLALGVAAPAHAGTASDESLIVTLINNYRAAHGLRPLAVSSAVRSVAEWRSGDMISRGYQGHQIPSDGCGTVNVELRKRGITFKAWGEIYAWNEGDGSLSATTAFDWWIGSSVHRAIILDASFTTLGVGASVGTWSSRRPACSGDSPGVNASGVHLYTVDFIEGPASSGGGGSGGGGGSSGPKPTAAPKPRAAPIRIPAASLAPAVVDRNRFQDPALLGLGTWRGPGAGAPPATRPAVAPSPSDGGILGLLLASLGIAAGLAYAGRRRLRPALVRLATRGRPLP